MEARQPRVIGDEVVYPAKELRNALAVLKGDRPPIVLPEISARILDVLKPRLSELLAPDPGQLFDGRLIVFGHVPLIGNSVFFDTSGRIDA